MADGAGWSGDPGGNAGCRAVDGPDPQCRVAPSRGCDRSGLDADLRTELTARMWGAFLRRGGFAKWSRLTLAAR